MYLYLYIYIYMYKTILSRVVICVIYIYIYQEGGRSLGQLLGPRGIPYAVTHDGRTLRYPDPDVKVWHPLFFFFGGGIRRD